MAETMANRRPPGRRPEWRYGRGWTGAELAPRLADLAAVPLSVTVPEPEMTPDRGWSLYGSEAAIAREAPGPPVEGDAFERARTLVTRYEFSDPRIVTGHFDPSAPLFGRRMLLEIRVLGLHYLTGVRVGAVREEDAAGRSVFGFRYDTYEGHLETGSEWFLLTKEHPSGEVRFLIRAAWRPGQFPNWWSRAGFHLVARRYQRAWHRLAYVRLRRLLGEHDLPPLPPGERLVHEGSALPAPPVQLFANLHARPAELAAENEIAAKTKTKTTSGGRSHAAR